MKSCFSHGWFLSNSRKVVAFNPFGISSRIQIHVMRFLVSLFSFALFSAQAATWYVDSSVGTSGNGTSWATAWKALSNVTGVSAGDTVYISGGASGSSQTYSLSSWKPAGGSAGNRITYQIGQDAAHNGTASFSGSGTWFGGANNVIVSGNAGRFPAG